MIKKTILLLFIFYVSLLSGYSQLDTLSLLKKITNKYANTTNGYIEYSSNIDVSGVDTYIKKKVWFVKDKLLNNIICLRLENYLDNSSIAESILILNEKQRYFINKLYKRSDVCTYNFLKGEELDNFYLELEQEGLPTFMIQENKADVIAINLYNELKLHDNMFLEILKDSIVNGKICFGIKLTDLDKNNGYIADITGKSNEKYADKKIETTYFDKKDTAIILKTVKYYYTNPDMINGCYEQINTQLLNSKQNTNPLLYKVSTDSLRNYIQTRTTYNGNSFESVFSEFNVKKASSFTGLTIDNKVFNSDQLKSKYILLGFWSTDCFECLTQLQALDKQYEELKALGLSFVAINSTEKNDGAMKEFLESKSFKFPTIFSKQAGKQFQINKKALYLLLDKDFNYKEIYTELNQKVIDKIKKKLK